MKAKLLLLVLLININCFSQYHDAVSNLQRVLEFTEKKQWEINASLDRAEQIENLRQQLEQLEETKKNVEQAYRLQQQIQDDLKVIGAVADGGVASLANAFETVLGKSINPANYIPNIPEFKGLRDALEYDASSYLSSDTRKAHKELFTYNYHDPNNKDGLSLTKHMRAFGKSTTNLIGLSEQWDEYEKEHDARRILQQRIIVEELRMEAKLIMDEVKREDHLTMSEAERMDMLLKASEMLEKASVLEREYTNAISLTINNQLPSDLEVVEAIEAGFRLKLNSTIDQVIQPYNTRQGFSLANFEKSYSKGKINMQIQRGIE